MSEGEANNAAVVRAIFEDGWNRSAFDSLDGVMAQEIPFRYNGTEMLVTPESLPHSVATWRSAFPDLEMRIRHLVARGDLVAVALTLNGTHQGEWKGVPASGRVVSVDEMMFFRFEGDVLAAMWEVFDEQGLRSQIDSTPERQ